MRRLSIMMFVSLLGGEIIHSQHRIDMDITSTHNVHFIVTDPLGRRTGRDPRGATNRYEGIEINEIPGSNYSAESVGDIPDSNETPNAVYYYELLYTFESPQNDGRYIIQVIGIEPCQFDLYVNVDPVDKAARQKFHFVINTALIDRDSVVNYQLVYNGMPGSPMTFKKIVTSNTLRQDLSAGYKLNLLGDEKLFEDLGKDIDKFEKELSQNDSLKARDKLEEFEKKLDKEREETIKHEQRGQKEKQRFMTEDAYRILKEDVQLLLATLPRKK